jgi:putative tryptophan/tyrosine transport system substrate-binding protein
LDASEVKSGGRPVAEMSDPVELVGRLRRVGLNSKDQLAEAGLVEGKSIRFEYLYADGAYQRLPGMAAEFVRQNVAVIAAGAPPAALAAKAATATIPIVFVVGFDPVTAGLVASYNRPGGNATGVCLITSPLAQKRLELIFELVPKARIISMLVNPTFPDTAIEVQDAQRAASAYGRQLRRPKSIALSL